jgi:hypothetical protein
LVSKHTTQNSIGVWEDAVNNSTHPSPYNYPVPWPPMFVTKSRKKCHKQNNVTGLLHATRITSSQ